MIQLYLLGRLSLETAAGPVTGRASQKRPLALLTLLALAPGRTLTRDKLIGWLWPDSQEEQARHLLSVALYELRKTLGEDAIVTRREDVQLGPRVRTDVEELDTAFLAGDIDGVIRLLRGPLLDGFHLSESVEFEQWLDVERERLAQRAAVGFEQLAEAKAALGDTVGAAAVWRRRAALDPANGRVALALMHALEAAGDRAGALQHARIHGILLREDFGAAPDGKVEAYAAQLREEHAPRATAHPWIATSSDVPEDPAKAPAHRAEFEERQLLPPPQGHARVRFHHLRSRLRVLQVIAGTAIFISLGVLGIFVAERWNGGTDPIAAAPLSVAVLPFRDLGNSEGRDLFGDAVGDEIIQALTHAGMRVAPLGSAFKFRGDVDAGTVGKALNVRYLIEGTYQRVGGTLKVHAHLVSVTDNRVLWTDAYEDAATVDDPLQTQANVARGVVAGIRATLAPEQPEWTLVQSTRDALAAREFTEGLYAMHRRTSADLPAALQHFRKAVAQDSTFARAHAALAMLYTLLGGYDYGVLPPREAYPEARRAAQRALQLDPNVAEAHTALGSVYFNYAWDQRAAERAFEEATRRNPYLATAWQWYGLVLSTEKRHAEALTAVLRAADLDPSSLVLRAEIGRVYYYAGDQKNAIATFIDAIARDSTFIALHFALGISLVVSGRVDEAIEQYLIARRFGGDKVPLVYGLLGHAYGVAGRPQEALAQLQYLQELAKTRFVPPEYRFLVYLGLGDHERALDLLDEAFRNRSNSIMYLGVDPLVDPLRNDPRFQELLRRVRLQTGPGAPQRAATT